MGVIVHGGCLDPHARLVLTALHRMQTRSSDENSVCPSVTRVL